MQRNIICHRLFSLVLVAAGFGSPAFGQGNQGGGGSTNTGGNTGTTGFDFPTTSSTNQGTTGGTNTGSQNTGGGGELGSDPIDLTSDIFNLGQFTDDRIQPFVGPSSLNIAHPRSFTSAEGGGGTSGAFGPGFSLAPGGRSSNQFGNQSGTGAANGVPRRGIRGAIRYDFAEYSNAIADGVPTNFVSRISRTPQFQGVDTLDVTVENRVATLSGTVANPELKAKLERQLLMEPGVSKVVNQLEIQQ